LHVLGTDGQPVKGPAAQAQSIQVLCQTVISQVAGLPCFRTQLDACHEYLTKSGSKPTGSQADTLAALKLVADFQTGAIDLIREARERAGRTVEEVEDPSVLLG